MEHLTLIQYMGWLRGLLANVRLARKKTSLFLEDSNKLRYFVARGFSDIERS
jgi:hypothetical protein